MFFGCHPLPSFANAVRWQVAIGVLGPAVMLWLTRAVRSVL
jgi:hypothetical protein